MWEIYGYQNADSLAGVFNAAAAIHASDHYASAVAAVAFCGFVAALVAYAFAPEKLQGWKWLATVVLVFGVLIVPKVTVGIVDKTGGSAVRVVDNVPFGVAVLGSLTSTIGHTLTGLFETAFQTLPGPGALPAELSYAQHGLLFGNRLIREASRVVFPDPAFRTDLVNFIHNCTTYDLVDGSLDPAVFSSSEDVWPLMSTPNPARFSTLATAGGTVGVDTCPNVYASLNSRLPAQVQRIQGRLAFQLHPTLPGTAAAAAIAGQVQQAYLRNSIANAASSAADLIRQNAMLNALEDTGKISGQKANDPAAMVLAVGRAQAVAQMNASWLSYGKVAEQALPVFRNVIEAVTYALFPLVVLMLLLTSGRETMLAFKGYAAILIWIQLWPPLYAILNYMASVYAAYDLAAAADLGTGMKALALQTSSVIYGRAISGEAIVGYLTISIPFLAWAALKRMESFGTALVGGLSGLQAAVSGSTAASAVGNTSLGNVYMDQMQLAPNRSSAFMGHWQHDLSGNTFSSNALTGRSAVSLLRNQGYASRIVSVRVSEQEVQDANRQVETARSEAVAATNERSAVLAEALNKGVTKLNSTRSSSGTTTSGFEQFSETVNRLDQISKSVADSTGISQSQVAQIALGATAQLGFSTPLGGLRAHAAAGKTYAASLSADERRVISSMSSEQLAEFKQFGDRVSRDRAYVSLVATDTHEAKDLSARLSDSTARSERAEVSLTDRTAFAERVGYAFERGETISIDIAQDPHNLAMFTRYAEQYGGSSASARILMEAELARQSPRPHRTFSDGLGIPASFSEMNLTHQQRPASPPIQQNIQSRHDANEAQVLEGLQGKQEPSRPRSPGTFMLDVRNSVRTEGEHLRLISQEGQQVFGTSAKVTKTADGTLASEQSLLIQAGKQVQQDAKPVIKTATQAVKSALDQK